MQDLMNELPLGKGEYLNISLGIYRVFNAVLNQL